MNLNIRFWRKSSDETDGGAAPITNSADETSTPTVKTKCRNRLVANPKVMQASQAWTDEGLKKYVNFKWLENLSMIDKAVLNVIARHSVLGEEIPQEVIFNELDVKGGGNITRAFRHLGRQIPNFYVLKGQRPWLYGLAPLNGSQKTFAAIDEPIILSAKAREEMTPIEILLFEALAKKYPVNFKNNEIRYHYISNVANRWGKAYTVDIFLKNKIGIECDGQDSHQSAEQRTWDCEKTRAFQKAGWILIRFTGTEITNNLEKCLTDIQEILVARAVVA